MIKVLPVLLIFLVSSNVLLAEIFYYKEKKELDDIAVGFLDGKFDGILISYPTPKGGDAQMSLDIRIAEYWHNSTKKTFLRDLTLSIKEKNLYDFLVLRGSFPQEYSLVVFDLVDSSDFTPEQNSLLLYFVIKILNPAYMPKEDNEIKDYISKIYQFVVKRREHGLNAMNMENLKNIDFQIVEKCFLRLEKERHKPTNSN